MMENRGEIRPTLKLSLITLNAALYASVGYLTYLGLFTPIFGTVRFWPAVIVPALFSILFSPWIGGTGAAIGIFISDMIIHGNPLLSLSVGVPSNFLGFYTIGVLARRWRKPRTGKLVMAITIQLIPLILSWLLYYLGLIEESVALIFFITALLIFGFGSIVALVRRGYLGILYASSIGLMVGSAIIGLGLWGFSQFFVLPVGGVRNAPLIAAAVWFLWTYLTEIPFLYFILPPLIYAVVRAMPHLAAQALGKVGEVEH